MLQKCSFVIWKNQKNKVTAWSAGDHWDKYCMLLLEKADLFKHSTAKTQHVVHTMMEASFTANSTGLPTMWEFTASYFSYVKGKRQLGVKQVSLIFHNWRNSRTKNKNKKNIKNWQFYCPIKKNLNKKLILSTVIRHQHSTLSTGGGKENVWSFIFAYFLYWSIHYHFFMETRRLVLFSCLFSLNEWKNYETIYMHVASLGERMRRRNRHRPPTTAYAVKESHS